MIKIEHLTKKFKEVIAVNDLSLEIDKGINGLVGENGAGKSTLLRLISGVYSSDGGTILLDGIDCHSIKAKQNMFFLSDRPYVRPNATINDTFYLYSSLFNLDEDKFKSIMSKLSLPLDRRVATFSKGMQRQFFIALSLSSKCDYIMLDEAFDGLDPIVLDTIRQEIITNSENKTFIISSHNMSSLERLCDSFIFLSKGRCANQGEIADLGQHFTKYQIIFNDKTEKEDLIKAGFAVLSFKNVGSINHVVFTSKVSVKDLQDKFKISLCEPVQIDPDELIMLEMLSAKEKEGK